MINLYICEDVNKAEWNKNIVGEKLSTVFAKKCICDFLEISDSKPSVSFSYNEYGKPLVKDIYDANGLSIDISLNFSLSHSENMIICAVACFNIGIDCQKKNITNINRCRKIAYRFYTDEENKFLEAQINDDSYIDSFFEIWVKKEAYIKYTGKGFAEGLTSFSVADEKSGQKNSYKNVNFRKVKLKGSENFFISLCHDKSNRNKLNIKYF